MALASTASSSRAIGHCILGQDIPYEVDTHMLIIIRPATCTVIIESDVDADSTRCPKKLA